MSVVQVRTERTSAPSYDPPTASGPPRTGTTASLLPEPPSSGLDGMQDAMSMMYELMSKQGQNAMVSGQVGVDLQNREQATDQQREAAALAKQEADEAALNCGSIFGEICHAFDSIASDLSHGRILDAPADAVSDAVNIVDNPQLMNQLEQVAPEVAEYVGVAAAIIGGAAFTAATCGTGGIVVAAVVIGLSASGMFVSETHCLGKDSAYIGLGMDLAGAVVSCGASAAMAGDACLKAAAAATQGIAGATDVVAGGAAVVVGHEQANVVDDTADVQQTLQSMSRHQRIVADLVTGMKSAQQSNSNALQALAGAAQTYNQTLTLASAGKA